MAPLKGPIKPKILPYICQLQIDGTVTSNCRIIKGSQRWLHPIAVIATFGRGLHQQSKSLLVSTDYSGYWLTIYSGYGDPQSSFSLPLTLTLKLFFSSIPKSVCFILISRMSSQLRNFIQLPTSNEISIIQLQILFIKQTTLYTSMFKCQCIP